MDALFVFAELWGLNEYGHFMTFGHGGGASHLRGIEVVVDQVADQI